MSFEPIAAKPPYRGYNVPTELLKGRMAKCACGRTEPSSRALPMFVYQGPDSKAAAEGCKHCWYVDIAHSNPNRPGVTNPVRTGECPGFEAHGPYDFDQFYCGCRGWD